jgi:hypothetical protein
VVDGRVRGQKETKVKYVLGVFCGVFELPSPRNAQKPRKFGFGFFVGCFVKVFHFLCIFFVKVFAVFSNSHRRETQKNNKRDRTPKKREKAPEIWTSVDFLVLTTAKAGNQPAHRLPSNAQKRTSHFAVKTNPQKKKNGIYSWVQGALKKKVTDPYVYLINFRGTNQPQNIIFLHFFFSTFLGVSRWGEFKNTV